MNYRTPAQFAADRRRSHKARALREQKVGAEMFRTSRAIAANYRPTDPDAYTPYANAMATVARMGRKHLNFLLTGEYADFV